MITSGWLTNMDDDFLNLYRVIIVTYKWDGNDSVHVILFHQKLLQNHQMMIYLSMTKCKTTIINENENENVGHHFTHSKKELLLRIILSNKKKMYHR